MFLVNSRGYLVTATPLSSRSKFFHLMGALLIPKLRSQFAEFLNQSSLKRLRILSSPTCVGLWYGFRYPNLRSFSRFLESITYVRDELDASLLILQAINLPHIDTNPHPPEGLLIQKRHSIESNESAGILTCSSSTTPFGLALDTD